MILLKLNVFFKTVPSIWALAQTLLCHAWAWISGKYEIITKSAESSLIIQVEMENP